MSTKQCNILQLIEENTADVDSLQAAVDALEVTVAAQQVQIDDLDTRVTDDEANLTTLTTAVTTGFDQLGQVVGITVPDWQNPNTSTAVHIPANGTWFTMTRGAVTSALVSITGYYQGVISFTGLWQAGDLTLDPACGGIEVFVNGISATVVYYPVNWISSTAFQYNGNDCRGFCGTAALPRLYMEANDEITASLYLNFGGKTPDVFFPTGSGQIFSSDPTAWARNGFNEHGVGLIYTLMKVD